MCIHTFSIVQSNHLYAKYNETAIFASSANSTCLYTYCVCKDTYEINKIEEYMSVTYCGSH